MANVFIKMKHLKQIKQNYFEHFKDAIYFSIISFKASYYFLIHAIYPDIYLNDGSQTINYLKVLIDQKKFLISQKNIC